MSESRDPAIKLFGRTIVVPQPCEEGAAGSHDFGGEEENKELPNKEASPESRDKDHESPSSEAKGEHLPASTASDGQISSCADQENTTRKDLKDEKQQSDTGSSQEKRPLKKPDKILPCPRCSSLDTKFCYFNNYNVNQPRHFCKHCQRYWTAGGTMRNVPVGAGRRKSKSSTSHYRQLTIPSATLQTLESKIHESIHHYPLTPNGMVLSFSSDVPLRESMANVLNLAEKTIKNCTGNGFHQIEEKNFPFSCKVEENPGRDDNSTGTFATASNHAEPQAHATSPTLQHGQGFVPQIPCVNGLAWPHPWSPAAACCAPSFAIPIYPAAAYWGCTVPGTWNIPLLSPPASSPPNATTSSGPAPPTTPSLGKHSRDGDVLKHSNQEKQDTCKQVSQEKCIWIPKTLRIDDPEVAARSSIWASLGKRSDKTDAISSVGLFGAFQPKAELKEHTAEASKVLHANPAALSRSLNFHESS